MERIYSIKGRSRNKPLILLGSKIEYLFPYISTIPEKAVEIIDKYLPGAVTLILPKSDITPEYITSGFDTVGIRIPDCTPFIELLENCVESHVLATTSANISGEKATASKLEVEESIGQEADYILDDYGYMPAGIESTVVSVDISGNVKILRQGKVFL